MEAETKSSSSPDVDPNSLEHIVYLIFTNQVVQAQSILEDYVDSDSTKSFLYALCAFLNGMASFGEGILDDALEKIWKAEAVGKSEGSLSGTCVRAQTHFLGSVIQLITEHYAKGMWNMRNSWNLFSQVKKDLEDYEGDDKEEIQASYDMFVGFFNLVLSLLPPFVIAIASYLGYSGDRKLGLHMINKSFESKTIYSPFAAFFLLIYYCNVSEQIGDEDPEYDQKAESLLKWANETYPKSIFFDSMSVRHLRSRGEFGEAIRVADEALRISNDLPGIKILFSYNAGWCAWMMMDYDLHLKYYTSLFSNSDASEGKMKNNFEGLYALMCGVSTGLLQKEAEAKKFFMSIPDYQKVKFRPFDYWVRRKHERFTKGRKEYFLDKCETIANFGAFGHMKEDLLRVYLEKLEQISASKSPNWESDDIAWCNLMKAYVLYNLGEYESAKTILFQIQEDEDELSKDAQKDGIMPHVFYVLGRIHWAQGDFDSAVEAVNSGEKYKGYDTSRFIGFRLYALKQIVKA
jgi:tetratricopeptide (TPR) repeat protein